MYCAVTFSKSFFPPRGDRSLPHARYDAHEAPPLVSIFRAQRACRWRQQQSAGWPTSRTSALAQRRQRKVLGRSCSGASRGCTAKRVDDRPRVGAPPRRSRGSPRARCAHRSGRDVNEILKYRKKLMTLVLRGIRKFFSTRTPLFTVLSSTHAQKLVRGEIAPVQNQPVCDHAIFTVASSPTATVRLQSVRPFRGVHDETLCSPLKNMFSNVMP